MKKPFVHLSKKERKHRKELKALKSELAEAEGKILQEEMQKLVMFDISMLSTFV